MSRIIFILGGARSGKSTFALELAKSHKKKVAFIATCQPQDKEMKERIRLHKKSRPQDWQTFIETDDIAKLLKKIGNKFECIIIDCLTLLVSNFILRRCSQNFIKDKINMLLDSLKIIKGTAIIVSNEVGLGIVPTNKLARNFRDIIGKINQMFAKESDEVYFIISGIPRRIK